MATFRATFGYVWNRVSGDGSSAPVMAGRSLTGLTELTTGASEGLVQSEGADWEAPGDGFVTMVCDGAVWVAVGSAPTAAVGTEVYLKADERFELSVVAGDKISVIDDS